MGSEGGNEPAESIAAVERSTCVVNPCGEGVRSQSGGDEFG